LSHSRLDRWLDHRPDRWLVNWLDHLLDYYIARSFFVIFTQIVDLFFCIIFMFVMDTQIVLDSSIFIGSQKWPILWPQFMLPILLLSNIISSKVAHPTLFLRRFIYFCRDRVSGLTKIFTNCSTSIIWYRPIPRSIIFRARHLCTCYKKYDIVLPMIILHRSQSLYFLVSFDCWQRSTQCFTMILIMGCMSFL